MGKKWKIKGGAEKMATLTVKNQEQFINSASKKIKPHKSDWEELIEACNTFAKEKNITHDKIQDTITNVRKRLNGHSC